MKNCFYLFAIFVLFVLSSCQPDEQRIRKIIREELASKTQRTAFTDEKVVGPYSSAQKVENFVFISGQIAIDPESGKLKQDNIEVETRQVLDNLMSVLRKTGCDSSDVISTTVYLTNMDNFVKMNNIYSGYFEKGNYPTRATVQVAALPRGANIEISAIAYKLK